MAQIHAQMLDDMKHDPIGIVEFTTETLSRIKILMKKVSQRYVMRESF